MSQVDTTCYLLVTFQLDESCTLALSAQFVKDYLGKDPTKYTKLQFRSHLISTYLTFPIFQCLPFAYLLDYKCLPFATIVLLCSLCHLQSFKLLLIRFQRKQMLILIHNLCQSIASCISSVTTCITDKLTSMPIYWTESGCHHHAPMHILDYCKWLPSSCPCALIQYKTSPTPSTRTDNQLGASRLLYCQLSIFSYC